MIKREYEFVVEGIREKKAGLVRGGSTKSLELSDAKVMSMDKEQWRNFVNDKKAVENCISYDLGYL